MNNVTVIHIVRRYGPVGGMEKYVWELTHGLMERGQHVAVVCEKVLAEPDQRIRVEKIREDIPTRPRWKSMLHFRAAANEVITKQFINCNVIVHSHERSFKHHVTTFHGPPFVDRQRNFLFKILDSLSARRRAWISMEKDELLGCYVKAVVTVSELTKKDLIERYPSLTQKSMFVGCPGVHAPVSFVPREVETQPKNNIKFLFVGNEWKRKGLDKAVELVNLWREIKGDNSTLDVFGPSGAELPKKITSKKWINVRGYSAVVPWVEFDMLIHLARKEPFGMVISEARAKGLPVVTSENVGANALGFKGVAEVEATLSSELVNTVCSLVNMAEAREPEVLWSWHQLVSLHLDEIYPSILISPSASIFSEA